MPAISTKEVKNYMNYKKTLISVLVITGASFCVLPTGVFAQETTTTPVRNELRGARCTRVTAHISELITRLTNDESVRQNRHQKVIDRLNSVIVKVEAAGINADKLKSDVVLLTEKKAVWQTEYTSLLSKLNATKQYACGASEGQFKQAVQEAKAQRLTMHNANMDFWNFVRNTVKPDIQALRSQLKAANSQ